MPNTDEILLDQLVAVSDCQVEPVDKGIQLSGMGYVRTPKAYQVPLKIDVIAKTDSTNLRLHFAKGQVILNWEENPDVFAVHEPIFGHDYKVEDKGRIPVNEWVNIIWMIGKDYFTVLVNDEQRFQFGKEDGLVTLGSGMPWLISNFDHLLSTVGIGPAWGSKVTVKSMKITELE
jgi:hypothetical protein